MRAKCNVFSALCLSKACLLLPLLEWLECLAEALLCERVSLAVCWRSCSIVHLQSEMHGGWRLCMCGCSRACLKLSSLSSL